MRSIGCLNGRIAKGEGLIFLLKILTNLSLLFLLKINYQIFPLKFYSLGRTPGPQKPVFFTSEKDCNEVFW